MSGDLERRYRRVLRLLPGWYREQWEQDMVAAFLDSWLTGDPETDECVLEFCKPGWAETASVAGLAVRLHLGGPGTPRRYAWGQAIRRAVLAVLLVHAVLAVNVLVFLVWSRRLASWLPAPPASLVVAPGGVWDTVYYLVSVAWIAIFVTLALGHYRTARVLATLAIVPGLVALLQAQLTGIMPAPFGPWVFWVLVDLAPVLAMTAFHSGAPPAAPGHWLLALPASYVLMYGPLLALQETGNYAWLPDFSGLCCILVSLACLAHAPRAWSRQARRHGAVVAGPGPAGCRRRGVPDRLAHRLPERPAPDHREPGRTAHRAGRRRAGRPRRRPRPDSNARTAAIIPTPWLPRRTQDMPFQRPPRPLSVLASALAAAGVVLAVAGCSHITPLGPDPAPVSLPPARDLGSPIIMQVMRSQPPTPTGRCPAG